MNRKQRIIISITGIVLVSLILIGLTYGYYLTKIKGNTNSKSISVTTANLYIEYNDNNDIITGDKIEPGTILPSKTFTVTNKGTENVSLYSIGLVNIVNTFKNTKDVVYTLSCNSSVTNKKCNGVEETEFPTLNSYIVNNSIDKDEIQTYTLTVTYKETGIDQSDDMNKELSAKIDIFDPKSLTIQGNVTNSSENDYVVIHSKEQESNIVDGNYRFIGITPDTHTITIKNRKTTDTKSASLDVEKGTPSVSGSKIIYNEDKNIADMDINVSGNNVTLNLSNISNGTILLKDAILTSAKNATGDRTIYQEIPTTTPGQAISTETERTLSKTQDDYGDSYYFRGNVVDNFINFAGMCWRIVRIEGDGSIKLILEDQNTTCESNTYTGNWNIGTGTFGYTENLSDLNLVSNNDKNYEIKVLNKDKNYEIKLLWFTQAFINYLNPIDDNIEMVNAFEFFQSDKLNDYLYILKVGDWCLGDNAYNDEIGTTKLSNSDKYNYYSNKKDFYYDSYVRLKTNNNPTNKCSGTNMNKFADNTDMYVGTLMADEIVYAGGEVDKKNTDFYLINDYQKSESLEFWSLSPCKFESGAIDMVYYLDDFSGLNSNFGEVSESHSFRPSITLLSNTQISSGDGTQQNPYIVK